MKFCAVQILNFSNKLAGYFHTSREKLKLGLKASRPFEERNRSGVKNHAKKAVDLVCVLIKCTSNAV
jgi:hypothetical protein